MDNYDRIKADSSYIRQLSEHEQTSKLCWLSLVIDPTTIMWIHNQTTKKIKYALTRDPSLIRYIKQDNRFYGFCKMILELDISLFNPIYELCPKVSRWIIRQHPHLIEFINPNDPNYEMLCQIAVSNDYLLLNKIINPSYKTKLVAISSNYRALELIDDRTDEMYRKAAKASERSFEFLSEDEYTLPILKHYVFQEDAMYETVDDVLKLIAMMDIYTRNTNKMFGLIKNPSDELTMHIIESGYFAFNKYKKLDHLSDDKLLYILNKNGCWIQMVSEERLTLELCFVAIKTTNALHCLPERFRTYELCLESVKHDSSSLAYVPITMRDYNMCVAAMGDTWNSAWGMVQYVPENIMDRELARKILLKSIISVPYLKRFLDHDLCLEIAKSHQWGWLLQHVPEEILDYEICYEHVQGYPHDLTHVPERFKTYELCLAAIKNSGQFFNLIPNEFICQEIIDEAVKTYPQIIASVDRKYHKYEHWERYLKLGIYGLYQCPDEFIDDNLILKALTSLSSYDFPEKYKHRFDDYEFCKRAIEVNPDAIVNVRLNRFYDLWITAAKRSKSVISHILFSSDVNDEYLYFQSFYNKQLCNYCNSTGLLKQTQTYWHGCNYCVSFSGYRRVIGMHELNGLLVRRRLFFKKVQMVRLMGYLKFARYRKLKAVDTKYPYDAFQSIANYLPFDVIKIIVMMAYECGSMNNNSINLVYNKLMVND